MAAQFCGGPDLFTPRTHLVRPWGPRTPSLICGERIALYLVPLARFRYCASPEASIMRLKAAAKMGATARAPNFSPQKLTMFLFGCPVLSIPHNDTLVYLVPPARSRYCASPEASIMRLKAAAKMGATASAPTQHFLPHKMAAQFCGGPELRNVFVIAPLLRRQSKKARAQPEHSTDAQRRQLRTTHYALICPSPVRHTVYEGCNPGFHLLRKK